MGSRETEEGAAMSKDGWWLRITGPSSAAKRALRGSGVLSGMARRSHSGLIRPRMPLVKVVISLPLSQVIHADHVFLGSNPAALRMARWQSLGRARVPVPSQHGSQESFQILPEAAAGKGVEDGREAAVEEGWSQAQISKHHHGDAAQAASQPHKRNCEAAWLTWDLS